MSPQPAADCSRLTRRPPSSFGPRAAWISLAACLVIAGAPGAEAAARPPSGDPACSASSTPCSRAPRPGPAPAADASAGSVVRLVLMAGQDGRPVLLGAGEGRRERNPFTLVGNRAGLVSAGGVEVRNGEVWLVPPQAPARGLAAFQEGGSSVASR